MFSKNLCAFFFNKNNFSRTHLAGQYLKEHMADLDGLCGAAPDEVPEVGGEDVLQDPLLVLLGRVARALAADHTRGWTDKHLSINYSIYQSIIDQFTSSRFHRSHKRVKGSLKPA